jgi:sulfate adenylyltransferase subunit 1
MDNEKKLLRFTTAGSVDDGKSTLIGRLLYDSKSIFQDQLEAVENSSKTKGFDYLDLSLLTDGLKSEREQGITIDVAYRYFETPKRKFIIADTPGHIQYTRNMVTGASTANAALILIDARKGIQEQTHRHSFIASLLGIPHVIVCINKMDLVDYNEDTYKQIKQDFEEFSAKLDVKDVRFIPISALIGDNVVNKSKNMAWYQGGTLLNELENLHISSDLNLIDCRFPIQAVIRPHREGFQDFRGYSGRISGGVFKKGDEVVVLPSGFKSKVNGLFVGNNEINEVFPPMSITMTLEDEIDISRGDMIVRVNNQPTQEQNIDAVITWMNNTPLIKNQKVIIKHTSQETKAIVIELDYEIDINTLNRKVGITELGLNAIGRVKLRLAKPIYYDKYSQNRSTGSFIIINPNTFETVGAGIIR